MTHFSGDLTGADGSKLHVEAEYTPPVVVTPPPANLPADPAAKIGNFVYPISIVNPAETLPWGGRGPDQLVAFTRGMATVNKYGVDVQIDPSGKILAIYNRMVADNGPTPVPTNGSVLSGHGLAAQFLLDHAVRGGAVQYVTVNAGGTPPSTPGDGGGSGGVPGSKTGAWLATWVECWSDSPVMDFNVLSLFDEVRPSFLNGPGPSFVGDGPRGLLTLQTGLKTYQTAGGLVSISVGGGQQPPTNLASATNFISKFNMTESRWGIKAGGVNWDEENDQFDIDSAIAISRLLKTARPDFRVSWSPNGSYIDKWLPKLAKALDVVDDLTQQFYDSQVSQGAAEARIKQMLAAKVPAEKLGIGMLVSSNPAKGWSLQTCHDNLIFFRDHYGIKQANLWEGTDSNATRWVQDARSIVGPAKTP